jgi:hypothetical protein
MSYANCQSCGMPINTGHYCQYCADSEGKLHGFDETVARMSQFMKRQDAKLTDEAARDQTLAHMAKMPAWQDHPKLKALVSS